MDDRELLELAAKAAGMERLTEWSNAIWDHDSPHYGRPALHEAGPGGACLSWNPLDDDGDALRLARSLLMRIDFYKREIWYPVGGGRWQTIGWHLEAYKGAIVRAAAEIGRAM